jgi:cysteine-rich repeat protein
MTKPLIRVALALSVLCLMGFAGACAADAACGDTVIDVGEQCDDGNLDAGDCCAPDCQFELPNYSVPCDHGNEGICWSATSGVCDGAGACLPQAKFVPIVGSVGKRFRLSDPAGTQRDSIFWKLRGGRAKCYEGEPGGNPSVDTSYAFCIWTAGAFGPFEQYYLDELVYENVIPPGAGWEQTAKGWEYRLRDETGSLDVRARPLARFRARGAYAALPGPMGATQYFDSQTWISLVNSAGYFEFMVSSGDHNTAEKYLASNGSSCN